jgi:hypothetical protein
MSERPGPERLTSHAEYAFVENATRITAMTDNATEEVFLRTVGQVEVEAAPGLKNYRTLLVNAGMAIAMALFTFLASVDWSDYVRPDYAVYVVIVINMFLRLLTAGPAMSNVTVKKV